MRFPIYYPGRVRRFVSLGLGVLLTVTASAALSPTLEPPARPLFADVITSVQRNLLQQIEFGKIGLDQGRSEKIRAYGDRIARDNQLGLRLLTSIAEEMKVAFGPLTPVAPHEKLSWEQGQELQKDLKATPSKDFDGSYLRAMEVAEAESVEVIGDAILNLPVSQARELFQRLRPIVLQHRELASILLKQFG